MVPPQHLREVHVSASLDSIPSTAAVAIAVWPAQRAPLQAHQERRLARIVLLGLLRPSLLKPPPVHFAQLEHTQMKQLCGKQNRAYRVQLRQLLRLEA